MLRTAGTRSTALGHSVQTDHRALVGFRGQAASLRVVQTDALLAAAVLDGADAAEIARRFGELTGSPVALLTAEISVAAHYGAVVSIGYPPRRQVVQTLADVANGGEVATLGPMVGWSTNRSHIAPLLASGQLLGFLVMYERAGHAIDSDLALSSFRHTASLCAIAILGERRRNELVNELRYDLVAGLLVRHRAAHGDRARWSELLGLASGSPYRVLCAEISNATANSDVGPSSTHAHVLEALAQEISMRAQRSVSVIKGSELLSLIPESVVHKDRRGSSAGSSAREAINRVRALFPSVELTAGLGRAHMAPEALAESGLEARNALLVQRRFSPSVGLLSFEDLGVYSLLYQVADTAELQAFVDRVLGRLIVYDDKRHADLLRTLRAILEHNGSLLNAARFIGVHVNTIAYRNERIKTITGLDLSRSDDRLMSYLALKIIDGLPTDGPDAAARRAGTASTLSDRLRALPSSPRSYHSHRSVSSAS